MPSKWTSTTPAGATVRGQRARSSQGFGPTKDIKMRKFEKEQKNEKEKKKQKCSLRCVFFSL